VWKCDPMTTSPTTKEAWSWPRSPPRGFPEHDTLELGGTQRLYPYTRADVIDGYDEGEQFPALRRAALAARRTQSGQPLWVVRREAQAVATIGRSRRSEFGWGHTPGVRI